MDFTRKTNLQEIALPRNIQTFTPSTYNSGAFYGCKNLTRVTFPEGLTAIGQNCFRNCAKLESIEPSFLGAHIGHLCVLRLQIADIGRNSRRCGSNSTILIRQLHRL